MLTREQKKKIVKELTKELKEARGIVFSEFSGLPTRELQELRSLLRKSGVSHKVVKLTLLRRVLNTVGLDTSDFGVQVPTAVSWSFTDEIAPAKILTAFSKTHQNLKILGGVMDKKLVGAGEINTLALLPGKQELRAQVVWVIASPLRGLVSVLSGNLRGLVNVLNAIKTAKP